VSPTISGTHAANSDPNTSTSTSTSTSSVNGTDRTPACDSCVLNSFVIAWSVLAAPASPT